MSSADTRDWQVREILAGIADAEAGNVVAHDCVVEWLRSWGQPSESERPLPWYFSP